MIESVLCHCTDMDIWRQYVDSHGQCAVGFAFCHLLGFELTPRLKAISRQKLSLPYARMTPEDYRGLSPTIYGHLNPYGRFDVDMERLIDFARKAV